MNTAVWVLWNLLFSTFSSKLLPQNFIGFAISMWMPALSAIVFLSIEKVPLKSGLNWGLGTARTFILAVLFPVVIAVVTVLIGLIAGRLSYDHSHQIQISNALATLMIWIASSLGEEIGWRGYLLNHLRGFRHAPLAIGVVWGSWHYRQLWQGGADLISIASFTVLTIFMSYFLSWLIECGGTVATCAVFHGVWNFLRLKVLFGNPAHGSLGYFLSSDPRLTDMEGFYGVGAVALIIVPFIILWYRKISFKPVAH